VAESPKSELARLRKRQPQARQLDKTRCIGAFPNLNALNTTATERINELDAQFQTLVSADKAAAEQRGEWNKKSETDMPQSEGRQPYRTREQDSTDAFTDFSKTDRTKKKPNPEGNRE
jgi:hypothetical protein